MQELRGHTQRVLCLAKSPDQRTICSASPDETLRFWDIWDGNGVDKDNLSPIGK
ncbi:hypothetical protein EON63_06405 [archaeon]|nr:MAG: hypothetical protein EON63_06405 [archaeon]